jgi:hypothetical protein
MNALSQETRHSATMSCETMSSIRAIRAPSPSSRRSSVSSNSGSSARWSMNSWSSSASDSTTDYSAMLAAARAALPATPLPFSIRGDYGTMRREDWGWDDPPRRNYEDFDVEAGHEVSEPSWWRTVAIVMGAFFMLAVLLVVVTVWAVSLEDGSGNGRRWHHHGHGFKHGLGHGFGSRRWLPW